MEKRITPSLVISVIALIVALGGTSYAVTQLPKNSVGTKQIRNKAVNSNKVKDGSLLLKDLKSGQVKPNGFETSRQAVPLYSIQTTLGTPTAVEGLPKGNYLALARANVVGSGVGTNVILCTLGDDAAQNFTLASGSVLPLSMNTTVTLSSPGAIALRCSKSSGSPQIAQAHVIAIPLAKLTKTVFGP